MDTFRPRRFQVSVGSLLLLMSLVAIGAALFGASLALGGAFVVLAFVAFVRTVRAVRHRRIHGSRTTLFTNAGDFLYSFWVLGCLIFLSPITVVFTVVIGTIHFSIKCWNVCQRLCYFLRVSSALAGLFKISNDAWRHLLVLDNRMIYRLSPSFGLPDSHHE